MRRLGACLVLVSPVFLLVAPVLARPTSPTGLVSVSSRGRQGNGHSDSADLSARGRLVAFRSEASDLVPGDTNQAADIFVRDRETGRTKRVSVSSRGRQGNADSGLTRVAISQNGRAVAFDSDASNLVPRDFTLPADVFVHDLSTHRTARVSVASNGSEAAGESFYPTISADGRIVAFQSTASNLVPGDTNGEADVFVHDRATGRTTRVGVSNSGTQGDSGSGQPATSADGRYVAFNSISSNLVPGDTNGQEDVFVYDRSSRSTTRVSVNSRDEQTNDNSGFLVSAISRHGRFVAFGSNASNLVPGDTNNAGDIFVRDRKRHRTRRVSVSTRGKQGGGCFSDVDSAIGISPHGRFVSFDCLPINLVSGNPKNFQNVFVRDRKTGRTARVSIGSRGRDPNFDCSQPAMSADARLIAFMSFASNLVHRDRNRKRDVFISRRP